MLNRLPGSSLLLQYLYADNLRRSHFPTSLTYLHSFNTVESSSLTNARSRLRSDHSSRLIKQPNPLLPIHRAHEWVRQHLSRSFGKDVDLLAVRGDNVGHRYKLKAEIDLWLPFESIRGEFSKAANVTQYRALGDNVCVFYLNFRLCQIRAATLLVAPDFGNQQPLQRQSIKGSYPPMPSW